jgi:hypothetical protein
MTEATDAQLVNSFEEPRDLAAFEPHNATVTRVEQGATHGERALKADFAAVDWPNLYFAAPRPWDWSDIGGLAFDVTNPQDEAITVLVRVDDAPSADGGRHWRTGRVGVPPGGPVTVAAPLATGEAPGMRAGPAILPNALHMSMRGADIRMDHIVAFQIFLARPPAPRTLIIDNLRLVPPPDLRGIVDRFGQYARADWPGKLIAEEQLAERRAAEERWLAEHPPPADRDRYGGWTGGPKLETNGFFGTARHGGRWWLVTPDGRLFFSLGVDCVRPGSRSPLDGRDTMFSWLPEAGDALAAFVSRRGRGAVDFYAMNLRRKYGEQDETEWVDFACRRLPAWGFNTIGNWSADEVCAAGRVPYTVPIHWGSRDIAYLDGGRKPMPDPFDEGAPAALEARIEQITANWRGDPWCIGYFVDNELSIGRGGPDGDIVLPRNVLAAENALPSKRAFTAQLRRKYGDIARLNDAWGTSCPSWDEFEGKPVALPDVRDPELRADLLELLGLFAERYFSMVRSLLKKHDPDHLYLGCRFSARPGPFVETAARHCDVITFNAYRRTLDPEQWAFTADLGKPCLIGEFHFGALDRGMFHTGLVATPGQAERAAAYQEYVRSVWALPAFVGCHWFQYADQALTGRSDGENYNIGFVTVTDTPYPEMVAAAREINTTVYDELGREP